MGRWIVRSMLAVTGLLTVACSDFSEPAGPLVDLAPEAASFTRAPTIRAGAVYLMSNAAGPNEVLVFRRGADGSLTADDPAPTGGDGAGMGLGNQGALALTPSGGWLLVVNPGSDDVSLFRVTPGGLELSDRAPSGGELPISVTVHGDLVYVLNAGDPNSISGLRIGNGGTLEPIAGSTRPLSGDMVGPAQIGFTPRGNALVVTEKGTNQITTYTLGSDGLPSAPSSYPSAGQTPFGFAFNQQGQLVVSEAFGGAADASTVSSYAVRTDGSVALLDGPVPTTETAACWIAISANGRFAYTTNTGSGSVTGLEIANDGDLTLLDADGRTGITGGAPIDAALSSGGRYLFVLSAGISEVKVFRTDSHGGLTSLPGVSVPSTANGMAVR